MRISTLLIATLLAASGATAQGQPSDQPSPPPSDAGLVPRSTDPQALADDPVGRIESRLERIERRLDAQNEPAVEVEPQIIRDPVLAEADNSRYRYQGGVWWYLLPSNRWVYWSNGAWVDYFPASSSPTVVYRGAPVYSSYYAPSYGYRSYYPSYRSYYPYYGGYHGHLGSAVGLGLSIGHGFGHGGHFGGHGGHFGGHSGHFGGHGGHGGGHGGHGGGHH